MLRFYRTKRSERHKKAASQETALQVIIQFEQISLKRSAEDKYKSVFLLCEGATGK